MAVQKKQKANGHGGRNFISLMVANKEDKISVLATAILQMGRMKKDESFTPEEVVQWIYPQHWQFFVLEVLEEMMDLYRKGKIRVICNGELVPKDQIPKVPVRIMLPL